MSEMMRDRERRLGGKMWSKATLSARASQLQKRAFCDRYHLSADGTSRAK